MCTLEGALGIGVGAPIEGGNGNAALYTYGTVDGSPGSTARPTTEATGSVCQESRPGLYMGIRAIAGDPQVSGGVYVALGGGRFLTSQF